MTTKRTPERLPDNIQFNESVLFTNYRKREYPQCVIHCDFWLPSDLRAVADDMERRAGKKGKRK